MVDPRTISTAGALTGAWMILAIDKRINSEYRSRNSMVDKSGALLWAYSLIPFFVGGMVVGTATQKHGQPDYWKIK